MSGNQQPTISVVIPLYNKEKYVRRAVDSVLGQTYRDFELIVVNDGSEDGGPALVRQYTDPRLHVVDQKNQGVSAARNKGINEAVGSLIAFLDADDEWRPGFLAQILELMNMYPQCGAYVTAYEIQEPHGKVVNPWTRNTLLPRPHGLLKDYFRLALGKSPISSSSVAVRRHVFTDVGGFPEGECLGEDGHMWLRIVLDYPIAYSSSVCAVYHREAEGRCCGTRTIMDNPSGEYALIGVIRKAIDERALGQSETSDLKEYAAKYAIAGAKDHILKGARKKGRALLRCCETRRFILAKWFWFTVSLLPPKFLHGCRGVWRFTKMFTRRSGLLRDRYAHSCPRDGEDLVGVRTGE